MRDIKISQMGQIEITPKPFPEINPESLLLLPTMGMVMFPGTLLPITLSRDESLRCVKYAQEHNLLLGIVCQKSNTDKYPANIDDMYSYGVIGQVLHVMDMGDNGMTAFIKAQDRVKFKLTELVPGPDNLLAASVQLRNDYGVRDDDDEFKIMLKELQNLVQEILQNEQSPSPALMSLNVWLENENSPESIINMVATHLPLPSESKITILNAARLKNRLQHLLREIYQRREITGMLDEIKREAHENLTEQQKKIVMQQQYDLLHEQLYGEDDDFAELTERADASCMPEYARKIFDKELNKLSRFNPQSPDFAVLETYLETLVSLPWSTATELNRDLKTASDILERDHYGMEKVKERVLEQLVLSLRNPNVHSPIICLVGAPGVGKTSLGRSIAEALGRKYERVSLGGIHDESEIRGHRRTYIGAMPGRIINSMQKSGVNNPLLLLDEIDKIGADYKGDPSAALLEVLDPEQNTHFHDNYVDVDYDLSNVFFIATANTLSTLPKPLLDRMEVIEMPGYLIEEKYEIAKRHLIPSICNKYGIEDGKFSVSEAALEYLIKQYTAESGVRALEKKLAEIARKSMLNSMRNGNDDSIVLQSPEDVRNLLGVETFIPDNTELITPAGVVTGLAWTSIGGEILLVEASKSSSKTPKLTLTGNLGDVMKESAMISLQYVRSHASQYGIDPSVFENNEIHIHVPEGAVPKDGPSAGITITTAIISLLTGRKVKPAVAMTGEMTLRGKVLPVGGIKEKILAAKRHGITDIYLSSQNRRHIEDIKPELLSGISFHYVETMEDVTAALEEL